MDLSRVEPQSSNHSRKHNHNHSHSRITSTPIVTTSVIITIVRAAHTYRMLHSLPGLVWDWVCWISARKLVEARAVVERLEGNLREVSLLGEERQGEGKADHKPHDWGSIILAH